MGAETYIAIFLPLLLSIFVSLIVALPGKQRRAAEEKARARRTAEHKMNARLLRLDI